MKPTNFRGFSAGSARFDNNKKCKQYKYIMKHAQYQFNKKFTLISLVCHSILFIDIMYTLHTNLLCNINGISQSRSHYLTNSLPVLF